MTLPRWQLARDRDGIFNERDDVDPSFNLGHKDKTVFCRHYLKTWLGSDTTFRVLEEIFSTVTQYQNIFSKSTFNFLPLALYFNCRLSSMPHLLAITVYFELLKCVFVSTILINLIQRESINNKTIMVMVTIL